MCRLSGCEMPQIKPRGLLLGGGGGGGGLQSSHFLTTSVCTINRKGQSCMLFLFQLDKSADSESPSMMLLPLF